MRFSHFSHNGQLLPIDQAAVPLNSVEYSYGFGVYESIRVSHGKIYFLDDHAQRLLDSAKAITLDHSFTTEFIENSVQELVAKIDADACNLKVLLIGGRSPDLYILPLNPLFPDRKLYKTGVHTITKQYEREYPQAKTLNMLPSYLAYQEAKKAEAYDALLINKQGFITEGTRTNFFVIKDRMITSPPEAEILPGITRSKVLEVAKSNGFQIETGNISLQDLDNYDGAFLTSTSAKIMPIKSIDDKALSIPEALKELQQQFNDFLSPDA